MKVELIISKNTLSLLGVRMWRTEGHHVLKLLVWNDGRLKHFYASKCVASHPYNKKKVFDTMYKDMMEWGKSWIMLYDFIPNCKTVLV